MCDPFTLALAAGTTLGQSALQTAAANDVADARLGAQRNFDNDLKNLRDRSNVQFQNSVETASRPQADQRIEQATEQRIENSAPSFDQNVLLPGQGDASRAAKSTVVREQSKGAARIDDSNRRRAILEAFGDADLFRDIQLKQNSERIQQAGNFARGAIPVLDADLRAAQEAGNSKLALADLLGAAGTVAGFAAPHFSAGGFTVPGTGANSKVITTAAGQRVPVPGVKPDRINLFSRI